MGHWVIARFKQSLHYLPNQKHFAKSANNLIIFIAKVMACQLESITVSTLCILCVHVGNHIVNGTTVESMWNNCYFIDSIIMIMNSVIPCTANIRVASRCKTAFGNMKMYSMNICMLNWFRLIYLDANDLIKETDFIFTSMKLKIPLFRRLS